jgi:hypothetical protein
LVLTLAHELQHVVQHSDARDIWAVNSLVNELDRAVIQKLNITWADIPIEIEARLVSKRVAESLFGRDRVQAHIDKKIAERTTDADAADWRFIRSLDTVKSVELGNATQSLYARLRKCRPELEAALKRRARNSPDFADIQLDPLFDPMGKAQIA